METWVYFFLTLAIELPLILFFFRDEARYALLIGFLLNLFTWPLLHVLIYYTDVNINVLEFSVAVTESIGLRIMLNCSWKKAIVVAFLVNVISYLAGLLLNNFL